MAKILLVEDDNNLREIYEARLQAEGYTIVSAQDGEEALVKAKQERPDLIISDVMMPRISGFEMLDILRNTEGLKDVKVIMLTALGQAEDKTRADALGADRYLVKSQVTLEDIVHAADELLNGGQAPADTAAAAAASEKPAEPAASAVPETTPAATTPTVTPMAVQAPPAEPAAAPAPTAAPVTAVPAPTAAPAPVATPASVIPVAAPPAASEPAPAISMPQTPASTPAPTPQQATAGPTAAPVAAPTASAPTTVTTPATPAPTAEPETPAVDDKESVTEATTKPAEPATVESAPAAEQADDQIMADAMKELTNTLNTEKPEVSAEPETKPAPDSTPETTTPPIEPETKPAEESENKEPGTAGTVETPSAPAVLDAPAIEPETPAVDDKELASEPVGTPVAEPETKPETKPAPDSAATDVSGAPATADEQALMKQQIDDFINQQGTGSEPEAPVTSTDTPSDTSETPQPAGPVVEPPAEPLATPSEPEVSAEPETKPAPDSTPAIEPETPAVDETPSDVDLAALSTPATTPTDDIPPAASQPETVQPDVVAPGDNPETPVAATPTGTDEDNVNIAHKKIIQPPVEPITTQPDLNELLAKEGMGGFDDHAENEHPTPGPFSSPPHQPGHVISPNGGNGMSPDDPNNIAL